MSIYDNAGVALIPSGTKASKLYSVLPANGDGDFNATRGSTATRVNKDGFIESVATNVPRLDYPLIDGVVQDCPALLLEPQRTNNLLQSNGFNTTWSATRSSVSQGYVSPDGSNNAWAFIDNTNNSTHLIVQSLSIGSAVHTFSIFAKKGTKDFMAVRFDSSTVDYAYFNLNTGTLGTIDSDYTSASMQDYGNGWYRCILTRTTGSSGNQVVIYSVEQDNDITYSGNTDNAIYIYGSQVEQGSYPTSYIPTSGNIATRSADVCNGAGTSAEFNGSEGVLFGEIAFAESQSSSSHRISLSNGTTSYRMIIQQNNNATPNRLQFYFIVTPSAQTDFQHTLTDITQFNKIAFKYKENDFAVWVNGVEVLTDTSGVTFPEGTVNQLNFDDGVGGNDFYGKTKQLTTFKTALTDSELETLTSWDSFNAMAKGQLYTIE
jgi:hypothetical protein